MEQFFETVCDRLYAAHQTGTKIEKISNAENGLIIGQDKREPIRCTGQFSVAYRADNFSGYPCKFRMENG